MSTQFVNGKLAEDKLISQFTSVSAGDMDKLTDMYTTLNFCSNLTRTFSLFLTQRN